MAFGEKFTTRSVASGVVDRSDEPGWMTSDEKLRINHEFVVAYKSCPSRRQQFVLGCNTVGRWPSRSTSICSTMTTHSRSMTRQHTSSSTPSLGIEDIYEVWRSDPIFYPAQPPAHWLMVSEVHGRILVVPLARADSGDSTKCRPIGCYDGAAHLATRYREDH